MVTSAYPDSIYHSVATTSGAKLARVFIYNTVAYSEGAIVVAPFAANLIEMDYPIEPGKFWRRATFLIAIYFTSRDSTITSFDFARLGGAIDFHPDLCDPKQDGEI